MDELQKKNGKKMQLGQKSSLKLIIIQNSHDISVYFVLKRDHHIFVLQATRQPVVFVSKISIGVA